MKWLSPVGDSASGIWPDDWHESLSYGESYELGYHTGVDLVHSSSTLLKPVWAASEGQVVFTGQVSGLGWTIVIEHPERIWTRYGHLWSLYVGRNQQVIAGQRIGVIDPGGLHLHFDIAKIDLGQNPSHWPGNDNELVYLHYLNPRYFLRQQLEACLCEQMENA